MTSAPSSPQLFLQLLRARCLARRERLTRSRWRAPWLCQVAGDEGAEGAGGAGDEDGLLGVEGGGLARPRRALPCSRATRGASAPLAQGELGLLGARGERGGQRRARCLGAVGVDQGEAAGVLGLGRAQQAPERGGGGVGGLPLGGGDRALG